MTRNPSFGLGLWGPLVPANDCKPCLYTLTGSQIIAGLMLWWLPGRNRPGMPPRKVWVTRSLRTVGILSGTYLMAMACFELVRLQLPFDPWAEDATKARREAEARGEKVSTWFGPKNYTPVPYKDWKRRMDQGIVKAEAIGQRVETARVVYHEIKSTNRKRAHDILTDLQRTNIIPRSMSEETSSTANMKENGESIDSPWDPLDAWDDLSAETDIEVRLMPHTKGVHEEE